jgi:uncharacterized protein involved in exopolysaccharide biosynthesis
MDNEIAKEREKQQFENDVNNLKKQINDLQLEQIQIMRKYKNRPTKNVYLHDVEYQSIETQLQELVHNLNNLNEYTNAP